MFKQPTSSDGELIRLAQQGELEAFNALYERYFPTVYNRVRYVIPFRDVEDVTQEVFITVMKSLPSFSGDSQFTTWLRTLTNRRVADYYRRNHPTERNHTMDIDDQAVSLLVEPDFLDPLLDDRLMLQQAIHQLPEHYREILLLRFAEDLQFNEIAELQGRTLDSTKSLFRRAIAALKSELEEKNVSRSQL